MTRKTKQLLLGLWIMLGVGLALPLLVGTLAFIYTNTALLTADQFFVAWIASTLYTIATIFTAGWMME